MLKDTYISLEKVAGQVNLPQRYIRKLTKEGKIPHLVVSGRYRYQLTNVRQALLEIEQQACEVKR